MNRERLIDELKNNSYPRSDELIKWYCILFAGVEQHTIEHILGKPLCLEIGRQLTDGWEGVYYKLASGETEVVCPNGATLYRKENGKWRKYYKALVKNNTPVPQCIAMLREICGRWDDAPLALKAVVKAALPAPAPAPAPLPENEDLPW